MFTFSAGASNDVALVHGLTCWTVAKSGSIAHCAKYWVPTGLPLRPQLPRMTSLETTVVAAGEGCVAAVAVSKTTDQKKSEAEDTFTRKK